MPEDDLFHLLVRSLISFGIGFVIGTLVVGEFGAVSERDANE